MGIAEAMADIALGFSTVLGAGYHSARIITQGEIQHDDGGSIIPGSDVPTYRACSAQVDSATEAMRLSEGFTEQDRRILVLAGTLAGDISTAEQIEFLEGPFVGTWMIESVGRDPAATYHELRGRPA